MRRFLVFGTVKIDSLPPKQAGIDGPRTGSKEGQSRAYAG